ncbi:hypothetical protein D3C76_1346770 [compost metagenome]
MAFGQALGERAKSVQAQATGIDRCQRKRRQTLHLRLYQGVVRVVILQAQRMGFQRGCKKQRRGNRVENILKASRIQSFFHGGSPLL